MQGAVASPHEYATRAGEQAFAAGGNAIDAALAAAAALTVVYPHQCAIGGDLFALVDDGRWVHAINGSGVLPAAYDAATVRAHYSEMPDHGPLSITTPGVIAAWEQIAGIGSALGLPAALSEAIRAADEGFAVSRSLAAGVVGRAEVLKRNDAMRQWLFPDGKPVVQGDTLRLPALAETLRRIAEGGADEFYRGLTAERIAAGMAEIGGPLSAADLAAHRTDVTEPLVLDHAGASVLTSPPNSQGFVLLETLAALQAVGATLDAPEDALWRLLAALQGAEDREALLCDPTVAPIAMPALLDPNRLRERLQARRGPSELLASRQIPAHGDTVAVCAMDEEGRAVSLIQSCFQTFGSGVLEPRSGVIFHNRARGFSLQPGAPNPPTPGTRPAHTLMPLLLRRDGKTVASLGTMGGRAQPQILMQILGGALDLQRPLVDTLAAPRWVFGVRDVGFERPTLAIEADAPAEFDQSLRVEGLDLARVPARNEITGHTNAVRIGANGALEAATDPRSDGLAVVV